MKKIFFLLMAAAIVTLQAKESTSLRIEPGLERAVKWKWSVASSEGIEWGLPARDVPVVQAPANSAPFASAPRPAEPTLSVYVVRQGDALVKIAKKLKLTVAQLKEFNQLDTDMIRIGQELNIPTPEQVRLLKSTPPPVSKKSADAVKAAPAATEELVLVRIFLDREGFSTGPISDLSNPAADRIIHTYLSNRGDSLSVEGLGQLARETVKDPFTDYVLKPVDFRFIATPKASAVSADSKAPAKVPGPVYEEMATSSFLAYRSPWEFVAERFGCDEAYLRKLNSNLPIYPSAGSKFRVPNVRPFEVEVVPSSLIQPAADPANPLKVAVSGMSMLEIYRAGRLIGAMPFSKARPSLNGRGEWKFLNAIPRPRMATFQESRVVQVHATGPFYVNPEPTPVAAKPVLAKEQFLPPGPNNPVGVVWMNLAKGDSNEALPFGLHGTSTPAEMYAMESIGGFRLSNRDIFKLAQWIPVGTPMEWKP
jgi:LysM repeat protein